MNKSPSHHKSKAHIFPIGHNVVYVMSRRMYGNCSYSKACALVSDGRNRLEVEIVLVNIVHTIFYFFYRCTVHFEIYVVHTPTSALFINLVKSFKFALKYTIISLLHVSAFNDPLQVALVGV